MKFDVLHNFISPVTGRVLADFNYVLVGNRQGIAIPSPILIDIRLDLIALKKRYNTLITGDFIIGHPNEQVPNAQVLVNLDDGFMFNTEGIVSTLSIIPIESLPDLQYTYIWIGDNTNRPVAQPTIQLNNLPNLTYNWFWIGDNSNRPIETNTLPIGGLPDLTYRNIWIGDITNRPIAQQRVGLENLPSFRTADPTSNFGLYNLYIGQFIGLSSPLDVAQPTTTLRIDMSNTPNLSVGKIWIGVRNFTPPIITIDGIFPFVHVIGSLNWDVLGAGLDSHGVANEIGLDPGQLFIGSKDVSKVGQIEARTSIYVENLPDLTFNNLWIGDNTNRPVETLFKINTGAGLTGGPITGNGTVSIANTTVTAGSYTFASFTVNAQGQLTAASSNTPSEGTVTEVNTGVGLIGGPITTTGIISIANTGVVPGVYFYATITVNAQGQLLSATSNLDEITTINENITTLNDYVSILNTTVFAPVTGLVNLVTILNTAIFAPVTGLVVIVGGLTTQVNNNTTNIAINTTNIATNTSNIVILQGNISTINSQITNIVNNIIPNLRIRAACRVATITDLIATYFNGALGIGATLTNNGTQVALVIDGITLSVNERVLVKDQSTTFQNGIYFVNDIGSSSTNWILTRATDFDGSIEGPITEGINTWIEKGIVNIETFWMETGDGPFTIGTTPIIFSGYPGQESITKIGIPLNNIPLATGDINVNNNKIINLNDPINPKDGVNLETLEAYVGGLAVELEGFVIGGPAVDGIFTTYRGPTCTLDVIPAASDVTFDNFAIIDLKTLSFSSWSDMEDKAQNGLNFLFLWQFFGGGVS